MNFDLTRRKFIKLTGAASVMAVMISGISLPSLLDRAGFVYAVSCGSNSSHAHTVPDKFSIPLRKSMRVVKGTFVFPASILCTERKLILVIFASVAWVMEWAFLARRQLSPRIFSLVFLSLGEGMNTKYVS